MDRAYARRNGLDDVRLALPDAVGIALTMWLRRARSAGRRAASSPSERLTSYDSESCIRLLRQAGILYCGLHLG
ncbi:MAG: hypothetical protein AT707_01510 [Pyrobaculum sp. JCHS_4]|jgi:hypothetical protein|nr:MAG: hypothetical protein AT707_01510 [Pyrobaculum sp. JCHS_4]